MDYSNAIKRRENLVKRVIILYLLANATFHILKISVAGISINSQLVVEALIIVLGILFIRRSGSLLINKQSQKLIFGFFLYVSLASLSILYTDALLNIELIGLWITLAFAFSLSIILNKCSLYVLDISNTIIYLGILQALLGILQVITGDPIVPKDHAAEWLDRNVNRASGTYRDPVDLAFYLSICIFLIQFKLYNSIHIRRFKILLYLVLVLALLTTQSLTVFAGIFFAYIVFITLSNIRENILYLTILMLVFSLFSITGLEFTKNIAVFNSIHDRVVSYSEPGNEARSLHLAIGLEILKDTSYIGVGYGLYDTTAPYYVSPDTLMGQKYLAHFKYMQTPYMISHNLPATILAELGILGITIFAFFYYHIVKPSLAIIKNRSNVLFFNASIVILVTAKFIGYGFRLSDAFLFFILLFTIRLYKHEKSTTHLWDSNKLNR